MGVIVDRYETLLSNLQCLQAGDAKREFKRMIRNAAMGWCGYCRNERATTVDHIKPRSKGGSDLRSNCLPCCHSCNADKGSEDWQEWFRRQEFYSELAEEIIIEWIENTPTESDRDSQVASHPSPVAQSASKL